MVDISSPSAELAAMQSEVRQYDTAAARVRSNAKSLKARADEAMRTAVRALKVARKMQRMHEAAQEKARFAHGRLNDALLIAQTAASLQQTSLRDSLPGGGAGSSIGSVSSSGGSSSVSSSDTSVHQTIMVTSDSLNDVLDQMRLNTSPTTYNFQGRAMQFSGGQSEDPTISSDDVTWRNGTIQLVGLQSLYVQSTGVVMEAITVNGGFEGVCVRGDGSLTMTDCEVHGAEYGLALSDTGTLEATTLKVKGCTESSFWLADTSSVDLTDCDIFAHYAKFAISMTDLSLMTGESVEISGNTCSPVFDLHDDASLSFRRTHLSGIPGLVDDRARLQLGGGCYFDWMDDDDEWDLDRFRGSGTVEVEYSK